MISLLATLIAIFVVVASAEIFWRLKLLGNESARKLVHILVGSFVASWGFFLSDRSILGLAGAMLAVVLLSRSLGIFKAIHNVRRTTWGELFFPIGIIACVLLTDSPWIFMAAMLHVSIADGLAAVIGSKYVRSYGYKVFKQQKTVVGTLTFFNASLLITLLVALLVPELSVNILVILSLPVITTAVENLAPYGADDLFVPVAVVGLLSVL